MKTLYMVCLVIFLFCTTGCTDKKDYANNETTAQNQEIEDHRDKDLLAEDELRAQKVIEEAQKNAERRDKGNRELIKKAMERSQEEEMKKLIENEKMIEEEKEKKIKENEEKIRKMQGDQDREAVLEQAKREIEEKVERETQRCREESRE